MLTNSWNSLCYGMLKCFAYVIYYSNTKTKRCSIIKGSSYYCVDVVNSYAQCNLAVHRFVCRRIHVM